MTVVVSFRPRHPVWRAIVWCLLGVASVVPVGHAQSVPTSAAERVVEADLSPVGLDLVRPLVQSGRWIWMGDSFSVPSRARVSFTTLSTWPLNKISGLAVGPQSQMTRPTAVSSPLPHVVTDEDGFLLARGTATQSRMGLPLYRLLEWELPAGETALGEMYLGFSLLSDGYAARGGSAFQGGTTVRPLLYRRAGGPEEGGVYFGAPPEDDFRTPEVGFSLGRSTSVLPTNDRRVTFGSVLSSPGFVHLAGSVISAEGGGHYAQFLADASWSYWGFGADADPSPPDSAKRFRTDDLVSYLRATTMDPGQAPVAVIHLAQERRDLGLLRQVLNRVVVQVREAFDRADLIDPVILFVHPQAIETSVIDSPERNERAGIIMREIALADDRVAFVSLYDATDGIVFDGRPEARAWLEGSRFDPFCYGARCSDGQDPLYLLEDYGANLLDNGRLHTTEAGALFFSAVLGEIVTGQPVSCEKDEVPPVISTLSPNPVRRGARVMGAEPRQPIYDILGRRVGRTDSDGAFLAPSPAGIYLVGGAKLVVQ